MPLRYSEAASLAFGASPFTAREFAMRTGSPRAARTLSELKMRGEVERVARGRYRLLSPPERPDRREGEWSRVRRLLLDAKLPMEWTGPEAVGLWTGWRYTVSPSVFTKVFTIDVPEDTLPAWEAYLRRCRVSTDPRRRIGAIARLNPVKHLHGTRHRGEPVIPREEVMSMIRNHRGIYAEASRLVERGT